MASIGHLAVGAAVGAWYSQHDERTAAIARPAIAAFAALALAPDLDIVGYFIGVPGGSQWGHRGFSHSFAVALVGGLLAAWMAGGLRIPRFRTGLTAFLALASHCLLDILSAHGSGPMLLWPFTQATYESPWQPIPGVISAYSYFSAQAIRTYVVETLLTLPATIYAAVVFLRRPESRVKSPRLLPSEE